MVKKAAYLALFVLFILACGSSDELPTLEPTAGLAEVKPPAMAADTPGAVEEPANASEPTITPTLTETASLQPKCTPPACKNDEVYFCPDVCPGGCGTICVTVTPSVPNGDMAQVVEVIDGDTIDVEMDGTVYRVRYIGMDTPERGMPYYQEATEANADLVAGQTVILVKDVSETDQYNRLLRYVYLKDGRMVNAELVRLGFAQQATYPPDVMYEDVLKELANEARTKQFGLWASPPTDTPSLPTNTPRPIPTNTPIPLPTDTPIPLPTDTMPPPPTEPPPAPAQDCDPGYIGVCILMGVGDYDCAGGSGNGPNYVQGPFQVVGPDPHGLDRDKDGIGCE